MVIGLTQKLSTTEEQHDNDSQRCKRLYVREISKIWELKLKKKFIIGIGNTSQNSKT